MADFNGHRICLTTTEKGTIGICLTCGYQSKPGTNYDRVHQNLLRHTRKPAWKAVRADG